jgi:hypothetical protein
MNVTALFAVLSVVGHIELDAPAPRFNDGNNKWCPCGTPGDGTSGPVTRPNDGCEQSASDDVRTDIVSSFRPGATITVRFREEIGHSGRMRVAFDNDGADQADFDANILADVPDPPGSDGNIGDEQKWAIDVTLPNTPCTNCTLQLIQVMGTDPDVPVTNVFGTDTYFQCASLVIAEGADESQNPTPVAATCAAAPMSMFGVVALCMLARRRVRRAAMC